MKNNICINLSVLALALTVICSCKDKGKEAASTSCANLTNDTLAAHDSAFVIMPTAFTPNGDGRNDLARPILKNITNLDFKIFDENSNVVFSTTSLTDSWNTTVTKQGLTHYYYRIQATTSQNHMIGQCGDLYAVINCIPKNYNLNTLVFEDQIDGSTGTVVTSTSERLSNCD